MSASCHLTASRPVWEASSSSSCLGSCFYHMTQQHKHCFYLVPVHCIAQLSRHATVLCSRCDITQYWVGTLYWKMYMKIKNINYQPYQPRNVTLRSFSISITSDSTISLNSYNLQKQINNGVGYTCTDCRAFKYEIHQRLRTNTKLQTFLNTKPYPTYLFVYIFQARRSACCVNRY